jgi:hypothetical protein
MWPCGSAISPAPPFPALKEKAAFLLLLFLADCDNMGLKDGNTEGREIMGRENSASEPVFLGKTVFWR